jgi:hypothetical protein
VTEKRRAGENAICADKSLFARHGNQVVLYADSQAGTLRDINQAANVARNLGGSLAEFNSARPGR